MTSGDAELAARYEEMKAKRLKLDLTRGKPSSAQLSLSLGLLTNVDERVLERRTDELRNYGYPAGIPEARKLFGEYLGAPAEQTFVLGNSSLEIMYNLVGDLLFQRLPGESMSWHQRRTSTERPAMLCPVPGYDRHHAICHHFGDYIDMIPVPLCEDGPDMRVVESLIAKRNVVGMWATPRYSNPTGITYLEEVCQWLARMQAPSCFRIIWDDAYRVHTLSEKIDEIPNMLELCREAGNPNRVFVIGSTSKITYASAGLAFIAGSEADMAWFGKNQSVRTIGPDKLNQLRHLRMFPSMDSIRRHMMRHRDILKPKFDAVDQILTRRLDGKRIAVWKKPRGGYFISFYTKPGCAKRTVEIARDLGVEFTEAGAAYVGGIDPDDSHIRIAPSFPPLLEVKQATEVLALAAEIAVRELSQVKVVP